jgi:hypothetical protein
MVGCSFGVSISHDDQGHDQHDGSEDQYCRHREGIFVPHDYSSFSSSTAL